MRVDMRDLLSLSASQTLFSIIAVNCAAGCICSMYYSICGKKTHWLKDADRMRVNFNLSLL